MSSRHTPQGCEQELLDVIAEIQCLRVVYVSCNPATLAWDIKFLVEKGYVVKATCGYVPAYATPWLRQYDCKKYSSFIVTGHVGVTSL